MQKRCIVLGLALLGLIGPSGCGGGSSSSGGGSNGMKAITWPVRGGGSSSQLPPAVVTGRVVFESQTGESCCVAVDASVLSGSSEQGLAILNDLPPGPATVTVAGFTTDFAPTVPGILVTCSTTPANLAHPCDPLQLASPAFESEPLMVTIVAGVQTNIGTVPMVAMPFLFNATPAQDSDAAAPVQFALTVVDAATNVRSDSVALDVRFNVPAVPAQDNGTPSPFRSLSKRVPLTLTACADGSAAPCSPSGGLQLAGFAATGTAPELPAGSVEAHITAENLGDPPQQLDFSYPFNVLATATPPATATSTATATASLTATSTATATSTPTVAASAAPHDSGDAATVKLATPSAPGLGARAAAPASGAAAAATPTATPTPH